MGTVLDFCKKRLVSWSICFLSLLTNLFKKKNWLRISQVNHKPLTILAKKLNQRYFNFTWSILEYFLTKRFPRNWWKFNPFLVNATILYPLSGVTRVFKMVTLVTNELIESLFLFLDFSHQNNYLLKTSHLWGLSPNFPSNIKQI